MNPKETLRRQPQWLVLLEALAIIALIGWADHASGWEWSFFPPYALPILLVTWRAGWRWGFAAASLCTGAYWLADRGSNPFQTDWGFGMLVFGRWFYFTILVVAVAALKAQRRHDRAHIATLERTEELEREILQIGDQEKDHLGRELHDGLCQTLAGISALSVSLSRRLAVSSEAAAAADATEIAQLLHAAIAEARDLARGLGPQGLETSGLEVALATLATNLERQFGVTCTIECPPPFTKIRHDVALHLYRIVQEGANNALLHGRAERIEIRLSHQDGQGLLSVQDDGVGLPEQALQREGVGLHTMATRARLLGGTLELRRLSPQGTAVDCTFPLPDIP